MSKCKYQEGDTVQIIRQGAEGSKVSWVPPMEDYNGKYAVITDCCSKMSTPAYSLDIDDGKWFWGEDCLVYAGETDEGWDYAYNVGDKVRIVKQGKCGSKLPWNHAGEMDKFNGRVAMIVDRVGKLGLTDTPCYELDIDNGEWVWGEDCLKDIDTTEELINTLIEEKKDEETFVINPPYAELDAIALEGPQTTIYWSNGDITTVTCHDEDDFDWEKGIALAVMKYAFGNDSSFNNIFHRARRYMNKSEYETALDNLLEEFAEKLQALEDEYK